MRLRFVPLALLALAVMWRGETQAGPLNIADGAPEISESGSWSGNPGVPGDTSPFGGQNITNGGDSTAASLGTNNPGYTPVYENSSGDGSFWLPAQDTLGYVTIDLGAAHQIGEIDLYNTHNGQFHDRSTMDFHIAASNAVDGSGNLVGGTTIVSGTLTHDAVDPNNPGAIGPDIFNASGTSLGSYRYLSFLVDSAYPNTYNGDSPGLNEIRVYEGTASAVPEPASLVLFALGLAPLALARGRRAAQV